MTTMLSLRGKPEVWASGIMYALGVVVDVRFMPREVQEIAYEKGLIPYVPADRRDKEDGGSEA